LQLKDTYAELLAEGNSPLKNVPPEIFIDDTLFYYHHILALLSHILFLPILSLLPNKVKLFRTSFQDGENTHHEAGIILVKRCVIASG
jgi:hypothetical protein